MKLQKVNRKHVSYVELEKDGKTPIGLSIKDGTKYGFRPLIKNIKAQSLSHRSHCVCEGDVVLSVCGEDSLGLSKKEVRRRLKEARSCIELTLQYESREPSFDNFGVYRYEKLSLRLRKESGSFGFILRKNDTVDSASSEYPTITNIRPGGPADKEKCLQDGDRLLKIDDQSLSWLSLSEVSSILKEKREAVFLIEYNVRIVDFSTNVGVQNEMEIDCLDDLGVILGSPIQGAKLLIQEIRQGSLAQRCGAFKQGDVIERINDIDTALLTPSKANSLLQRFRKESGKLVFIPSQGGQCLQNRLNPNVVEMVDNRKRCNASNLPKASHPMNHSKMKKPSKERTQAKLAPSPNLPHNIPSSSDKCSSFPQNPSVSNSNRHRSIRERALDDFVTVNAHPDHQCKTLAMLTDVVRNVSQLGCLVSRFDNEVVITDETDEDSLDTNSQKSRIKVNPFVFSQLKSAYDETKTSVYSLALHVTKHHKVFPWDIGESSEFNTSGRSCSIGIKHLLPQVTNDLSVMERKNLLPRDCVVKLRTRLDAVKEDCEGCHRFCMSTLHLMQKVTLLLSFNNGSDRNSQNEVKSLLEKVRSMNISCDECSKRTELEPGRKILRVQNITPEPANLYKSPVSQQSSGTRSKLNQLSINSETTASGVETARTTDCTSDSVFNIKVCSSTLKQTNIVQPPECNTNKEHKAPGNLRNWVNYQTSSIVQPPECRTNKEPKPSENHRNWVNYQTSSDSKVHKEKDCFQRTMKSSDSENILSSDENDLQTPPVVERRGSDASNDSTTRVKQSASSSNVLEARDTSLNGSSSELLRSPGGSLRQTTSSDVWETTSEGLSSLSRPVLGHGLFSTRAPPRRVPLKTRTSMEVKLKDEGFGLGFDVEHTSRKGVFKGPYISYIHQLGAAKKCGIIRVGDKILEVNGLDMEGLPVSLLDSILRQSLKAQEVVLKVEFEIAKPEFREGTFDVRLEKGLKCGIMFEGDDSVSLQSRLVPEFRKGAPMKVRGVVRGSAAHRSGLLFPGDEVVAVRSIKEESYEPLPAEYKRQNFTLLTVRRAAPITTGTASDSDSSEGSLHSLLPSPPFVVHRSMVRTLRSKKKVVDHELTLYRDFRSTTDRFGFAFKQNHGSGNVYVSKLRTGGPAEASRVIQVEDRILEVNGTIIGRNNKSFVAEKFKEDNDFIDLVTRRILS